MRSQIACKAVRRALCSVSPKTALYNVYYIEVIYSCYCLFFQAATAAFLRNFRQIQTFFKNLLTNLQI